MEATYYTYFLYALIAMFISIAIILSAKNDKLKNKLRISKKNNDDQKTIIGSQSAEIARVNARLNFSFEDLLKIKNDLRGYVLAYDVQLEKYQALSDRIKVLSADLPARREKESDAQYFKRCRQSVANKAAKYVKIADQITLRVISHD
jgi:hypothetical protein